MLLDISIFHANRSSALKKVKTSTKILFTANTIDGLASSSAKMSGFFEGSVVLKQKAIGVSTMVTCFMRQKLTCLEQHGLPVAESNCTSGSIQAYLDTGKLPEPNTLCDTNFQAFPEPK